MKKIIPILIVFILLQWTSCVDDPVELMSYGSLEGVVLNEETLSVEAGALVTTNPSSNSVITDEEGKFYLESIPVGDYDVVVEKDQYVNGRESIVISKNATTQVTVLIQKKTEENLSPSEPTAIYPLHLEEKVDLEIDLAWAAFDENEDDSLTYNVLMYSNVEPQIQTVLSNSRDTFLHLDNLDYGTTYFWQVIVSDGVNAPINGSVWQFQTKEFPNNRILFTRKVNGVFQIFSGSEDGNETQLTDSTSPAWRPRYNPDRTKIAFISLDGIEKHIFIMDADGSNIQKITEAVSLDSFDEDYSSFAWNPNGGTIIYMHFNKLYKISIDGSGLELVNQISIVLSYNSCDWTDEPTSKMIVRTSSSDNYQGDLYITTMDGNFSENVFPNTLGRTGGGTFSVDGNQVLFTHDISGFEGQDGRQLNSRIHLLNLNDLSKTDLSSFSKPDGTNDLDPRFSPDGAFIIFTNTNNDGLGEKNIYKMNLSGQRTLLFENAEMPDWR